jgi:hypothetical protein
MRIHLCKYNFLFEKKRENFKKERDLYFFQHAEGSLPARGKPVKWME